MMLEQTGGAWLGRLLFIDDAGEYRDTSRRATDKSTAGGLVT
jgi:hypothetical protein